MSAPSAIVHIPSTGTYRIDPSTSTISFSTTHRFGTGKVSGSFELSSGQITVAEPLATSAVTAVASSQSFATGNAKRDAQVKSKTFLHAEAHPQILFRSTELIQSANVWLLRAEITTRGTSAPVELTIIESNIDGTGVAVRAIGTVDRYAQGITKLKGMAGRYLQLEISVHASRI